MNINISGICYNSLVNGEGLRAVIFTQGCRHNCKGCFNKDTHSFKENKLYNCDELVNKLLEDKLITGITFSGGDPFEQSKECAYMAKKFKENGLNIWSYTGYLYEDILNDSDKKEFLNTLDVLVDGKFNLAKQSDNCKFRGSSNQRVIDVEKSYLNNKVILKDNY